MSSRDAWATSKGRNGGQETVRVVREAGPTCASQQVKKNGHMQPGSRTIAARIVAVNVSRCRAPCDRRGPTPSRTFTVKPSKRGAAAGMRAYNLPGGGREGIRYGVSGFNAPFFRRDMCISWGVF